MVLDIAKKEEITQYVRIRLAGLDEIHSTALYQSRANKNLFSLRDQKSRGTWKLDGHNSKE